MILTAIIDDQEYTLNVPDKVISQGQDFFARLDADMDKGWQMSREWVQSPNRVERCQIVADKLLTALENGNKKLGMLTAGYILSRMPEVTRVEIDISGEIQNTQLIGDKEEAAPTGAQPISGTQSDADNGLGEVEAVEQVGNDVTEVYKVGKAYRFSVFDQDTGVWQDSPMFATEQEAQRLRRAAVKERFEALQRGG